MLALAVLLESMASEGVTSMDKRAEQKIKAERAFLFLVMVTSTRALLAALGLL